jgi:hypothetical protein
MMARQTGLLCRHGGGGQASGNGAAADLAGTAAGIDHAGAGRPGGDDLPPVRADGAVMTRALTLLVPSAGPAHGCADGGGFGAWLPLWSCIPPACPVPDARNVRTARGPMPSQPPTTRHYAGDQRPDHCPPAA